MNFCSSRKISQWTLTQYLWHRSTIFFKFCNRSCKRRKFKVGLMEPSVLHETKNWFFFLCFKSDHSLTLFCSQWEDRGSCSLVRTYLQWVPGMGHEAPRCSMLLSLWFSICVKCYFWLLLRSMFHRYQKGIEMNNIWKFKNVNFFSLLIMSEQWPLRHLADALHSSHLCKEDDGEQRQCELQLPNSWGNLKAKIV